MATPPESELVHLPGCPAERSETFERQPPDRVTPEGETVTPDLVWITRCIDCGAQTLPVPPATGPQVKPTAEITMKKATRADVVARAIRGSGRL